MKIIHTKNNLSSTCTKLANIAVFGSGKGSNFSALLEAQKKHQNYQIKLLISDNKNASILKKAREKKIPSFFINPKSKKIGKLSTESNLEISKLVRQFNIDLIVLAGFMRIINAPLLSQYKNRILNIHPSLLPKHKGINAIKKAFDNGDNKTGVSIHIVTNQLDSGPILTQKSLKINASDTLQSLNQKIHKAEHLLYPKTLSEFIKKNL